MQHGTAKGGRPRPLVGKCRRQMNETWLRAGIGQRALHVAALMFGWAVSLAPPAVATPLPFQREFQLDPFINSIVRPRPPEMSRLELIALPKRAIAPSVDPRDLKCMAIALYFEARGEPADGNIAVAQVILNRVKAGKWRNTICGVINQGRERGSGCQFSFACAGYKNPSARDQLWLRAVSIAHDVLSRKVSLKAYEKATFFHATYVDPSWRHAFKRSGKIGRHIFYEFAERPEAARRGQRRRIG